MEHHPLVGRLHFCVHTYMCCKPLARSCPRPEAKYAPAIAIISSLLWPAPGWTCMFPPWSPVFVCCLLSVVCCDHIQTTSMYVYSIHLSLSSPHRPGTTFRSSWSTHLNWLRYYGRDRKPLLPHKPPKGGGFTSYILCIEVLLLQSTYSVTLEIWKWR